MSTALPPAPPASTGTLPSDNKEIRIVSHSMLFYWWPVWAVGLLMGALTFVENRRIAIVPESAEARRIWVVEVEPGKMVTREGIILMDDKQHLLPDKADKVGDPLPRPEEPHLRVSSLSSYGVIWATVLLLTIVITNVPLRGLWSVIVIVMIIMVILIFSLLGWWDAIFSAIRLLDIRINAGGYFFISLILFGIWLATILLFDRQLYMIFTPGQLKVRLEIGGGETAYDTIGMTIHKQRDDLFRHWILGLGSGDLIVKTSGANAHEFHMNNVLFVGRKLQMIEQMLRDRPVVKGQSA